jgi:hypothetical protein
LYIKDRAHKVPMELAMDLKKYDLVVKIMEKQLQVEKKYVKNSR